MMVRNCLPTPRPHSLHRNIAASPRQLLRLIFPAWSPGPDWQDGYGGGDTARHGARPWGPACSTRPAEPSIMRTAWMDLLDGDFWGRGEPRPQARAACTSSWPAEPSHGHWKLLPTLVHPGTHRLPLPRSEGMSRQRGTCVSHKQGCFRPLALDGAHRQHQCGE